jgi:hypothetical protein
VVRFRTASECVMSSFMLTPVYRWASGATRFSTATKPSLPLTLVFWMKTTTSWMWNIILQTKLSLLYAGFLDENDDLWDEYASC